MRVKICGLSTPESITTAIIEGADFIGLVFYPPSPRHVDIETAAYLARQCPESVALVGLFVNPDDAILTQVLDHVKLSMIQLHGDEDIARVREIQIKFGLPVMKAIAIKTNDDLKTAQTYDGVADWLLFDAKGETLPGGNGVAFDWSILKNYQGKSPWILAGGLNPDNLADALSLLKPDAVDVSSGVESAPGVKDCEKIAAFIRRAKQHPSSPPQNQ